jgi:hypothetical protein
VLSFSNATGNIFNLLGRLGGIAKKLRTYQTDAEAIMTDTTNGVVAHTKEEADVQAIMGSSYLGVLSGTGGSVTGTLQSVASAYLNRLVYRDNPRFGQSLSSSNTTASLGELVRQMEVAGATVRKHTVAGSVTDFTGDGDGKLVVSVKRPVDGLTLENLFAETLTVVCSTDSYLGGATAGNETLTVLAPGGPGDPFAFDWPQGSGASATLEAVDGSQDNSAGNLLTNSGFESFTSDVPDNWVLEAGTASTNVADENSIVYDPEDAGSSLRLIGDGSTLTTLYQVFGDSDGTSADLAALTQYSVCLWLARDGVAPAAGVMVVELVDGDGAIVKDEAGVDNSFEIDLTALSTGFAPSTGAFRTPLKMPDELRVRLRMTTALTTGRSVYVDRMSMAEMVQLYASGPFVACHSGKSPFVTGDLAQIVLTNSRGAGGSLDTFQTLVARLFPDVVANEIQLPSSDAPTVDDGLIF